MTFKQYFKNGEKTTKCNLMRLRDGNFAWIIDTSSFFCEIRHRKCGSPMHKSRTTTFKVWATGYCRDRNVYDELKVGSIKQMCLANSCTDGFGTSKIVTSEYLGSGILQELKDELNKMLKSYIQAEIVRLQLNSVQPENCLFGENDIGL